MSNVFLECHDDRVLCLIPRKLAKSPSFLNPKWFFILFNIKDLSIITKIISHFCNILFAISHYCNIFVRQLINHSLFKCMENIETSIAPILKKMERHDKVFFSLSRYTSVNSAIQRIQTEYPEKKFEQKKFSEERKLRVIRTVWTINHENESKPYPANGRIWSNPTD